MSGQGPKKINKNRKINFLFYNLKYCINQKFISRKDRNKKLYYIILIINKF